jgi:hypothetical protein
LEGNSFLVSDKERKAMGLAAYEIIGNDAEWRVRHDGKAENVYEIKEAAFEAAAAAASLALRQGHEVRISARTGTCQRVSRELSKTLTGGKAGPTRVYGTPGDFKAY